MAPRPTLPALVLLAALLACAAAPSAARTLLEDAAPKPGSGLAALSNALQKAAKAQRAAAAGAAPAGTAATPAAVTTATPRQGADAGVGVDPSEITFSLEFNPKLSLDVRGSKRGACTGSGKRARRRAGRLPTLSLPCLGSPKPA
jgi:hypothetical protein